MKRRGFLQALIGAPAMAVLPAAEAKLAKGEYDHIGRVAVKRKGARSIVWCYDYQQLETVDGFLLIVNPGVAPYALSLDEYEIVGIQLPKICQPLLP